MRLFIASLARRRRVRDRRLRPGARGSPAADDPYLWLEDVSGARAMEWVNAHNAKAQAVLEADPRYQILLQRGADHRAGQGPHPVRPLHRRPDLQLLAGRRPCPRHLRRTALADLPARRSRPGRPCSTSTRSPRPRRRTGCSRASTAPARPSGAACQPLRRRRGRGDHARVRPRHAARSSRRLRPPRRPSSGSTGRTRIRLIVSRDGARAS